MQDEEQDNLKRIITQRFIDALDYLLDSGKLKTVVEFENITGLRAQRITGMRKYLDEGENVKPYYASVNHIHVLNEKFGVSFDYVFKGEKPIVKQGRTESRAESFEDNPRSDYIPSTDLGLISREVELLKCRMDLFQKMWDFHKEKGSF